jgi:hypothetical protein
VGRHAQATADPDPRRREVAPSLGVTGGRVTFVGRLSIVYESVRPQAELEKIDPPQRNPSNLTEVDRCDSGFMR